MKSLFLVLALLVSVTNAQASGKSELAKSLSKVLVRDMDEEKLIKGLWQAVGDSAFAVAKTREASSKIILTGSIGNNEHFVIEVVTVIDDMNEISGMATTLRLSTNTKNPALYADMYNTLKLTHGKPTVIGENGERIAEFPINTNGKLAEEKLAIFLSKAKSNSFNKVIDVSRVRPSTVQPHGSR